MLISHISAQDAESCQDEKKEAFPSCLVPPPPFLVLSVSSAPHSVLKLSRRLSRLPRSLHRSHTGKGVWEVAVHQCLLTFISICRDPSQSEATDVYLSLVLGEYMMFPVVDACYAFIITPDKTVFPQSLFIYLPHQISVQYPLCTPGRVKRTV